jgi:hypothetical protein
VTILNARAISLFYIDIVLERKMPRSIYDPKRGEVMTG